MGYGSISAVRKHILVYVDTLKQTNIGLKNDSNVTLDSFYRLEIILNESYHRTSVFTSGLDLHI